MVHEKIKELINDSIKTKVNLPIENIEKAINVITECLKNKNKILVCGNGGSAADAQHMSGEFLNRFKLERNPLPCMALTTDTSTITAISNDYSFDEVFSKQVDAFGRAGDVIIGISTSGNSKNIIKAIEKAKQNGIYTIGLLGNNGGLISNLCDLPIIVSSNETPRIQESHILIIHIICEIVEKNLFS